jgi:hypothetical protein
MARESWETLVNAYGFSNLNSGIAYKTSKALTDVSPGANTAGQALQLPANFLVAGSAIRFTAAGVLSHKAEACNLTFGLYYGGVAGKALAATAATAMGASALTTLPWWLTATTRVISTGATGKVITQGFVHGIGETAALRGAATFLPEKAPETEVAIDTTTANILTLGALWSVESAENTLQCLQWLIEVLN